MDLFSSIAIALVTFGLLVTFHEFGHFWVARRCGVKVVRFSIGFGKTLFSWHDRRGTEYVIGLLPLGGYVKMVDEREGPVADAELDQAFNRKSLGQRTGIVAAGPIANFLLAIVAYWFIYLSGVTGAVPLVGAVSEGSVAAQAGLEPGMEIVSVDGVDTPTWRAVNQRLLRRLGETGELDLGVRYENSDLVYESSAQLNDWLLGVEEPDLLGGLGVEPFAPSIPPQIEDVVADSPAARAGLQAGDLVVSVDDIAVVDWQQWVDYVRARPDQSIAIEVEREQSLVRVELVPAAVSGENGESYGQVGVRVAVPPYPEHLLRKFSYSPISALGEAVEQTWTVTVFTLDSIKKLLTGLISPKNLSGPITIAKVASASAESGLVSWLGVLALLSISLGVLNLLPIPVLDGGHLLFYLVEWVKGSPVSDKVQNFGFQVGVSIVLCIMLFALYNDISRL
jgi:regulator of sigma E protease